MQGALDNLRDLQTKDEVNKGQRNIAEKLDRLVLGQAPRVDPSGSAGRPHTPSNVARQQVGCLYWKCRHC